MVGMEHTAERRAQPGPAGSGQPGELEIPHHIDDLHIGGGTDPHVAGDPRQAGRRKVGLLVEPGAPFDDRAGAGVKQ